MAQSRVSLSDAAQQEGLFPVRLTSPFPAYPNAKDISAIGFADDGGLYYCKGDDRLDHVRATELVCTKLADHLGIPTAPCRVVEDSERRNSYFGSLANTSVSHDQAVRSYLLTRSHNELGIPDEFAALFVARLYALDLFVGNPDRIISNHVAVHGGGFHRIAPIDFADATFLRRPDYAIPEPQSNTCRWRQTLDRIHGVAHEATSEMLTRIEAVPYSLFESLFDRMPVGWLDPAKQDAFGEFWVGGLRRERLAAIRTALSDGRDR